MKLPSSKQSIQFAQKQKMKIEETKKRRKKKLELQREIKKSENKKQRKKLINKKLQNTHQKPKENQIIPISQMTTKELLLHLLINQIKDKKLKRIQLKRRKMKSLNQLISIFKRLYYQVEKLKKEPLKHLKNLNDDKNKSAKKTSKKILELPEKINEEDIDAMTRNMLI